MPKCYTPKRTRTTHARECNAVERQHSDGDCGLPTNQRIKPEGNRNTSGYDCRSTSPDVMQHNRFQARYSNSEMQRTFTESIMRYYFYIEWTFRDIPSGLDSVGPYHSRLETDHPELNHDWKRLRSLKVVQFDTKQEVDDYWKKMRGDE